MALCCTGLHCPKRYQCGRYYANDTSGEIKQVENLYWFGSGGINTPETYWCGEYGNWGMYVPIQKENSGF